MIAGARAARGSIALAWRSDTPAQHLFDAASGNSGARNRYWYSDLETGIPRFVWRDDYGQLSEFQRTPGEAGAAYLSDAEKDAVLDQLGFAVPRRSMRHTTNSRARSKL